MPVSPDDTSPRHKIAKSRRLGPLAASTVSASTARAQGRGGNEQLHDRRALAAEHRPCGRADRGPGRERGHIDRPHPGRPSAGSPGPMAVSHM
jgi:hypothetical protein